MTQGWYERLFAALYDPLIAKVEKNTLFPLRSRLLDGIAGTILDIGAGTGANLPFFENPNLTPIFLDRSFPMLQKGIPKGMKRRGGLVIGSASALPFPEESFDNIVTSLVLCSVEDLSASLDEIERTLKKDGTLFLMEHVLSPSPFIASLQKLATPAWKRIAGGCHLDRATDSFVLSRFREEASWQEMVGGLPFFIGRFKKLL